MITATIHSDRTASVHERPSWLARLVLGSIECDYEANRVLVSVGHYEWLGGDNRPVSPEAAEAIARAEARAEARTAARLRLVDYIRSK